ncbi:TylF/MycF/NovP-related O-methyltransferase [Breoghania sp.]|uniref:TylF/MycF/NovP-related O-methyltransferase n=1 Tax=Breoghania sp. TaxID=2065378 RepID=UPI002AA7BE06|nr:TylF/MycF/NovP-related O-methyltransferase [Breoghania sp.]
MKGKKRSSVNAAYEYSADNLAVRKKNLGFMRSPAFANAWEHAAKGNVTAWNGRPKDVRWRAHTAVWAAQHGLKLEGDFVECGVFLGFLSMTICHALNFAEVPKTFYLFDTFEGLPEDGTERTADLNGMYFDCYEQARKNFSPFPNAKLVRGCLPGTLDNVLIDRIAYLSVDLNHAATEDAVIHQLWDRLTPSAIVLIDDYAFAKHEEQHEMWDAFAASKGCSVLTMPTGSGVLIKP